MDPNLGGLKDFDEMSAVLHDAGILLIADIVPNHSSNRHAWFREALASPKGSPARDRYIFRDGKGAHGEVPPSDWVSVFGGPAWERIAEPDGTPGQWYMHIFAREQPDLNWSNREVRDDFLKTRRFGSDRGVDGSHPFWDRDEVHAIYAEWREVFNTG